MSSNKKNIKKQEEENEENEELLSDDESVENSDSEYDEDPDLFEDDQKKYEEDDDEENEDDDELRNPEQVEVYEENYDDQSQGSQDETDTDQTDGDDENDDEDYDDENQDNYFQKFNQHLQTNLLQEMHPELNQANYDEIVALSRVVRDENGYIVDPLHTTLPFLTKYEKARIIGARAEQLDRGAPSFIPLEPGMINGTSIALKEFMQKKIPFILARPLPNGGIEYWNLKDLEIVNE